jgi:hypothetical protein
MNPTQLPLEQSMSVLQRAPVVPGVQKPVGLVHTLSGATGMQTQLLLQHWLPNAHGPLKQPGGEAHTPPLHFMPPPQSSKSALP